MEKIVKKKNIFEKRVKSKKTSKIMNLDENMDGFFLCFWMFWKNDVFLRVFNLY